LVCGGIAGFMHALGNGEDITLVKEGYLQAYPDVPIGKAIDNFMASPSWTSGQSKEGLHLANVSGRIQYMDKPVQATIQFIVYKESGTLEVYAFEMNGIPQNNLMKASLTAKMCEEYRYKRR